MANPKKPTKAPVYFREWRKHMHLTQDQAGERAELDQSTIQRIENGKIDYTRSNLEALAFAYGCAVPDLFRPPKVPENELAAYVMTMDARKRAKALKVLRAALEGDGDDEEVA